MSGVSGAEAPALYYYDSCPYCQKVMVAARALGVQLELRNIHQDPQHLRDLREARGRSTVPVLRRGDDWMPESDDIVRYLAQTYGDGTIPRASQLAMAWRMAPLALLVAGAFLTGATQAGRWSAGCLLLGGRSLQSAMRDRSVVQAVRGVAMLAITVVIAARALGAL